MVEKEKYKIWFDQENEILRAEILEKFEPEDAVGFVDFLLKEFNPEQQRYFLVNIYHPAQVMPSKETRTTLREKGSLTNFYKMAICGAKPGLRMVGRIVVAAIGKANDSKFFATEEEALAWLKNEKEKEKESK